MTGKNPLPYYILLYRLVERCTPVGDLVFTSGVEIIQELNRNGQLAPEVKQSFFHTWTNRLGYGDYPPTHTNKTILEMFLITYFN